MSKSSANRSIRIEESAVGSSIISGDGNTIYVIHPTTEQKWVQDSVEPPAKVGPNPYKGLAAFKESNADQYFGREAQVERLWQRFQALYGQSMQANGLPRLLPILGPSGCGKSSLARAGLIPELARRPLPGKEQMRIAVLVPGSCPVEALAGVLAKAATQDSMPVAKTREFTSELRLKNEAGLYNGMRRIVDLMPQIDDMPLIVLIDQFEEVYSLCKDKAEREAFIDNLLCAAGDPTGNVSVVLTLRSDFLGETQGHQLLTQVIGSDQSMVVPGMTEAELIRAIAEPAKQTGYPLDEATVNLLVKDTEGREGALPLLQFALTRIWEGLSEGKASAETYQKMGGVGGSLAGQAQEIYNELGDAEKDMVRRVFIGLVQLGEGTRDTRRRVAISNLVSNRDQFEVVDKVIDKFSLPGVRLVTLSRQREQKVVEVTHEALLDHWQLFKEWIDESRDDIRFHRRFEEVASSWHEKNRPDGSLWRRPDLDSLKGFWQRAGDAFTPIQVDFFKAATRAEIKRKFILGTGIIALIGLSGVAILFSIESKRAENKAIGQRMALQSEWLRNQSPDSYTTSALLAAKASQHSQSNRYHPLEVDRALREALFLLPTFKFQVNHQAKIHHSVFSPDGNILATTSSDKTTRLWDVQSGLEIHQLHHEASVNNISFSPDGKTVATASSDKTARIWNVNTGLEITKVKHDEKVNKVIFSPDGKNIATSSNDKTVRLWDVRNGKEIVKIPHDAAVGAISFNSKGSVIATGTIIPRPTKPGPMQDGTATLWSLSNGGRLFTFKTVGSASSLRFSPDGGVLAVNGEFTTKFWNVLTGEAAVNLDNIANGQATFNQATFSPNGAYIATVGPGKHSQLNNNNNYLLQIWDSKTGEEVIQIGLDGIATSVAFSPDSSSVITSNWGVSRGTDRDNHTARLWDIETGAEMARFNHEDYIDSAAFSPSPKDINGNPVYTIATTSGNLARVWDSHSNGTSIRAEHNSRFGDAIFSPDGKSFATVSSDKTATLWGIEEKKERVVLSHEDNVHSLDYSVDSTLVATASHDGKVRIWDALNGVELTRLDNEKPVQIVAFADNNILATASYNLKTVGDKSESVQNSEDSEFNLWNIKAHEKIITEELKNPITTVKSSPNGRFIVVGSGELSTSRKKEQTVRIWDVKSHEELSTPTHDTYVSAIAFSPDSRLIAVANDQFGMVWDVLSGEEVLRINHETLLQDISFSPSGNLLATAGSDNTARIWDVHDGKELARFNHELYVGSVTFSPDELALMTGSWDNTVRLWDISTGSPIARLSHKGIVNKVAFSPDGQLILSVGQDNTVMLRQRWPWKIEEEICRRISRNLTALEWTSFLKRDIEKYELICPNHPVHPSVIWKGQEYADSNLKKTIAIFKRVIHLDPYSDLIPQTDVKNNQPKLAAMQAVGFSKVKKGKTAAAAGKLSEAIIAYEEAQKIVEITADDWNNLCWNGSLHRHAEDVMFACEKAVELEPSSVEIRDSRGLARALIGNTEGAIEDFQDFVDEREGAEAEQRKDWIKELKAGRDPFTDELLESLL